MIIASSPAAARERHWLEYSDEIGYLDGTDPYVRMGISEEGEEVSERDPISMKMRRVISPFRPNLYLVFYQRNPNFPSVKMEGWSQIGKYRIWRYWCEIEGKKKPRAKSLKVLTGEALPGLWLPTENPFTESQDERQLYGMIINRSVA